VSHLRDAVQHCHRNRTVIVPRDRTVIVILYFTAKKEGIASLRSQRQRDRAPKCVFVTRTGIHPASSAGHRLSLENALIDRVAGHGDEVAHQVIGDMPVYRELVLALELLDRGLGVWTDGAGRLQLAIAIFG
jgi:hypothetical protein